LVKNPRFLPAPGKSQTKAGDVSAGPTVCNCVTHQLLGTTTSDDLVCSAV